MKNYKKVIALLMTASMTLGLAACGGKGDDSEKKDNTQKPNPSGNESQSGGDDTEKVDPYTVKLDPKTGEAYDLGGMEIIIRDWWSQPSSDENLSGYAKAQKEYRDWLTETYHFTVKEQSISGWGDVFTDLESYVVTGGDENNYVFTMRVAGELIQQMKSDFYYDLTSLDSIDMSEVKWDQAVKDFGTLNGKVYFMRRQSHEPRTGVFFNKRLLKENDIDPEEIYELQRTHQWTWDKFVEYMEKLTKDTNADGVMDQYGVVIGTDLWDAALVSNKGSYIEKDANGKYYNNLESENTLEALVWADMIREKYNMPNPGDAETWDYFKDAFRNGLVPMLINQAYFAGQLKSGVKDPETGDYINPPMEDEFGFVAFPMGPKSGGKYSDLNQDNIHVIPSCYDPDKANKIAFAYSMYFSPVPEYEDYSDYFAGYIDNFCDMTVPEETLGFIGEQTVLMMHGFVPGVDPSNNVIYRLGNGEGNTPASLAEECRESWQAYIDAANGES